MVLMKQRNRQLSTELGRGTRDGNAMTKYQVRGDDMTMWKSCGSAVDHK